MSSSSSSENPAISLQEMQETVSRLSSHKGVQSVLILNRDGDIVTESTAGAPSEEGTTTAPLAKQSNHLLSAAQSYLASLDPQDEVAFLQIRSRMGYEVMIAPHEGYVLAVLKRL